MMAERTNNFMILVNGEPHRHYVTGQIRTYLSRENAEKQARSILRTRKKYVKTLKESKDIDASIPKYEVAEIMVTDKREVIE